MGYIKGWYKMALVDKKIKKHDDLFLKVVFSIFAIVMAVITKSIVMYFKG